MLMKKYLILMLCALCLVLLAFAQPDRWQQRVKYSMNIDMNVQTNRFTGKQKLEYWNNSPDTLSKVFYHLYWNAFQPNSMMDNRSRRQGTIVLRQGRNGNDIVDWDQRVRDRIQNLKPEEYGYQKILSLKMNGRPQTFKIEETILEVKLDKPILPKSKVSFEMEFESQVPLQIRRSGRDNPTTKVRYSMSQWYPKICEYDYEGWHPTPYVAREFYGVWGDFDVTISIDKKYIYVMTNEVHPGERNFYKLQVAGGKAEKLTSMTGANEVSLSPDEKWIAFRNSYSNKPWELYLQETKPNSKPQQITNSLTSEFKSYAWRDPEVTTFKARDGADVYIRLFKPSKPNGAAVVFVHGAGYLQNAHKWWSTYFREYMFHNLLADKGYTVIDMDYRASAGYGRDAGDTRSWSRTPKARSSRPDSDRELARTAAGV